MREPKLEIKVDNWWLGTLFSDPKARHFELAGEVYGHPDHKPGAFVVLTDLIRLDMEKKMAESETAYIALGNMQTVQEALASLEGEMRGKMEDELQKKRRARKGD